MYDFPVIPGDYIGTWKVVECNVYNPNTKDKQCINKPVFAKLQCIKCKKERLISLYNLKKLIKKNPIPECKKCRLTRLNELNKEVQIGKKYGKLTVIDDAGYETRIDGRKMHLSLVKCSCGKSEPFIVRDNNLQSGSTKSCGCIISQGEERIKNFLIHNEINFKREFTFLDLVNPLTSRKLRFDFAIFDCDNQLKCLIEFDGRQHVFGPDTSFWSGNRTETLEQIQYKDELKNIYCKENNINLIRIPYTHINQIETILEQQLKQERNNNGK